MKALSELRRHSGNAALFHAARLSLVGAIRGTPLHLHAQGVRGTGKTSVLRAAGSLLPQITRVKGCLYNCDPEAPHCPEHGTSQNSPSPAGTELVPAPFRELSHSTKVATAVGSLDLARLVGVTDPAAALLPGLLPQAHRGVVFVDEINRLADTAPELTDILLDVMGTKPGRIQLEESGLPTTVLQVTATVWAASNPDEDPGPLAEIRRQLSDRFDLAACVARPEDPEVVRGIITAAVTRGASRAAPDQEFYLSTLKESLIRAAARADEVTLPDRIARIIADIYCRFEVESLRAVEGLALSAVYNCALRGGTTVRVADLLEVVPLVLAHRLEPPQLKAVNDYLANLASPGDSSAERSDEPGRSRPAGREKPLIGLHPARRLVVTGAADLFCPEDELR